jgi:type IV pilus assembly protein PilV
MRWKHLVRLQEGFTLLEIMVALVILSIGLIALAGLQISALRGNTFSKRMTTAVSIAETKLEQIKNMSYGTIQSESTTSVTQSNINFTRQVIVTDNTTSKTVEVKVTWVNGSKSYTVPVSTIISQ